MAAQLWTLSFAVPPSPTVAAVGAIDLGGGVHRTCLMLGNGKSAVVADDDHHYSNAIVVDRAAAAVVVAAGNDGVVPF